VTSEIRLRTDGIEWREVEGEIVALELESSSYLAANPTATTLWSALVEGTTREALVRTVVEQYAVEEAVAGRDVDAFLAQLREQGLLVGEESPDAT
jgi:hypothetical protein